MIRPILIAALLGGWCNLAGTAHGQTLLRWKLQAGEAWNTHTQQRTESSVEFSSKSAKTTIDMQLDLHWEVLSANETKFTVRQTINRLALNLTSATGSAEFDSAAKTRPTGLARQLSDALAPLIGAAIETEMNNRGEVLSATATNDAAAALFQREKSSGEADAAATVQQAIAQSILQLPEQEIAKGGHWQITRELSTPAGPHKLETTYTLVDFIQRDGDELGQLDLQARLVPPDAASAAASSPKTPIRIKDHQQSGRVLFSVKAGRVVESEQTQTLVTERPYRDTLITVTLQSTQKTTVR